MVKKSDFCKLIITLEELVDEEVIEHVQREEGEYDGKQDKQGHQESAKRTKPIKDGIGRIHNFLSIQIHFNCNCGMDPIICFIGLSANVTHIKDHLLLIRFTDCTH